MRSRCGGGGNEGVAGRNGPRPPEKHSEPPAPECDVSIRSAPECDVSIAAIGVGDNITAIGDFHHGGMTPVQSDLRHGGVTGTMVASILATPSLTSVASVMRAQIVSLKDMLEPKPHC